MRREAAGLARLSEVNLTPLFLFATVAERMAQNMRRHRQLGDALVEMGREIRAELSSRASGDMFDRADVGMTENANEAIQRQADRNRDPQQGRTLFSETRRATAPGDRQDQRQESGRGADAAAADAAPRREALALQRHAAHQENGKKTGSDSLPNLTPYL